MERKIFLVRHLKTDYNQEGRIMGGQVDMDVMNNAGAADKLSDNIKTVCESFDIKPEEVAIISSPLLRCVKTAGIVRDAIDPKLEIDRNDSLQETNMGDFTDKKASDLRQEYGDVIDDWMYNPEEFKFPGGESYKDVRKRVKDAMELIRNEYPEKRVVILCSHVDIIKMFICEVQGTSFNTRRSFKIPNASISVVSLSKNGNFEIEGLNIYP